MAHTEMRRSRVLVAAAGLFFGLLVLWLRVGWLQVVRHDHYEARAAKHQERRRLVKPIRGEIRDRHGRQLARDLQSHSITADPRRIEDKRGYAEKLARYLAPTAREIEKKLRRRSSFVYLARKIPPKVGEQIEALELPGIGIEYETRREYLLGEAATEIVGRTDLDNGGIEGVELQHEETLRGAAGWYTVVQVGNGQSHELKGAARRPPRNGRHLSLTIDADLQSIVETHLARAVDTLSAERGFALFLDPRTGEILAAATVPHSPAGLGRNWNLTDQIEPGSTFKIVAAAAALEEQIVTPEQWFEASEEGKPVEVAPDAKFTDVHKEAGYAFRDAVRWSSNIVMGQVGVLVGDELLYRYCTEFGFGSITGLGFPGEASGMLRTPDRWSLRSAATIAIGYEVSVTPLQLALAYGVIANGGRLMHPMLVREVRDDDGVVRRYRPHAARRVLEGGTARLLREFLTAVVDSGTARTAQVPGIKVAGKTGTARKLTRDGRYTNRRHVSSFAGFAPANDPSLVGVVVIDEPRVRRYYGGDVAAPVFREILMDVLRMPGGVLRTDPASVARRPRPPAPVAVPDLAQLPAEVAARELRTSGLRPEVRGEGERVIAQVPPAGQAVQRGTRVTMWLAAPESMSRVLPDVTGLAAREAVRLLSRLEIPVHLEGQGVVVRQSPRAGTRLPLRSKVRLRCKEGRARSASRAGVSQPATFMPAGARERPSGGAP